MILTACNAESLSRRSEPTGGGVGGATTDASSSASGGGSDGASGVTFVGSSCASNDACGTHPDNFCILPADSQPIFTSFWGGDEIGGGVAGGYCTRGCSTDDLCPEGSRCGGGICLDSMIGCFRSFFFA